jgi:hypothetical protein
MAIKKRWIEALAETVARETVQLPWTRGARTRGHADTAPADTETPDGAPA